MLLPGSDTGGDQEDSFQSFDHQLPYLGCLVVLGEIRVCQHQRIAFSTEGLLYRLRKVCEEGIRNVWEDQRDVSRKGDIFLLLCLFDRVAQFFSDLLDPDPGLLSHSTFGIVQHPGYCGLGYTGQLGNLIHCNSHYFRSFLLPSFY